MSGHPSGKGVYAVRLGPIEVTVPAHTARAAYVIAGPLLGWPDYSALEFELLEDRLPGPLQEHRHHQQVVQRRRRRPIGRLVGAERGSVRP